MTQTPSKFTMNSDYLSIAQTGKYEYTYVGAPETVPAGGQIIRSIDFTTPSQKGAIDQIMIKRDSGNFRLGQVLYNSINSNAGVSLTVYRTSPTTIHAEYVINNMSGSSQITTPAIVFTIKINTFKPPNVF